jgi:hypothetical protein
LTGAGWWARVGDKNAASGGAGEGRATAGAAAAVDNDASASASAAANCPRAMGSPQWNQLADIYGFIPKK